MYIYPIVKTVLGSHFLLTLISSYRGCAVYIDTLWIGCCFQICPRAELFTINMGWGVNMQLLYTIAKPLQILLLDFSKQCTDAILEGLSNITTQICYPLCVHKKLNKIDDSKKGEQGSKVKKYGNKLEVKKLGNKSENGNKLKIKLKVYYIQSKILRHLLSLFGLHLFYNG